MALIVKKYGGTSVGSLERIGAVADQLARARAAGDDVVVVVSAMSGETNRLLGLARELSARPSFPELDVVLATGEQVTVGLLSIALQDRGVAARSFTGAQIPIRTDEAHGRARILEVGTEALRAALGAGEVCVVAGFQGSTGAGRTTTLGRGGSDTTAMAIAVALGAAECQIYTDVDGVYTTDPRIEPRARRLDRLIFEEMLELASLGAKVLQIRSVEFASKYSLPVRVLSSFEEGLGTVIGPDRDDEQEGAAVERPLISGIAFNRDEAKITILGVPDRPGVAFHILGAVAEHGIEVDMIVQNISRDRDTTDFTFTVNRADFQRTMEVLGPVAETLGGGDIIGDDEIVKISLVGVGMRSNAGIASRMFEALANENINIQMISTSEIKVSVVVEEKYLELGVRALHSAFELERAPDPVPDPAPDPVPERD